MSCGKVFLVAFCGVLISGILFGQSIRIDSLTAKLTNALGKERVDVLNQLTYEFITNDNDRALAYNSEALRLSHQIGYDRGEARAYTYRGVEEYLSGQLREGHRDLNIGLRLATQAGDEALQGYTLLQLGSCSLEEVEMDSAFVFFKRSREVFKHNADLATLSKLYRNIGVLYGQRYQPDSQMVYLDSAIRIRRQLPDKALLVEALILKIKAAVVMNDFQEAQVLLNEVEATVTPSISNAENRNDIRHVKALVLFQQEKFAEAHVLVDSARKFFLEKSLLRKYVTLLIDLARVFTERGEYEMALINLYEALTFSDLHHFEAEASIIRIQLSWIYRELGSPGIALRMADDAMNLYPRKLLLADRANALMLKGVALSDMTRYAEARTALAAALKIYSDAGSTRGQGDVLLKLGLMESRQRRYDAALEYYQESVRLSGTIAYDHGLAWSYWGLGDTYLKLQKYGEATAALDQSLKYAGKVASYDVTILNYTTRRDLLSAQGRYKDALTYAVKASQMRDSIHNQDIGRRFITLEKMREIQQQERDIRLLQTDKQLAENRLSLQEARIRQQSTMIISGAIAVVLLTGLVLMYHRFYKRIKVLHTAITAKNKHIVEQADKLTEANRELKQLYQEVSDQKEEIQVQADKLGESNRAMGDVNRQLENLVTEKTAELRRTNNELIKYNHELLQFSYTVSHNLRGPVARLLGLADLAAREKEVIEAKHMISLIGKTAHDLDMIIKDLSNILELRNEPHRLLEIVQLEKEWEQSKSLLKESLPGDEEIVINFAALPELRIVRAIVQSIFFNLLSNAIKYRSPERQLRVIATSSQKNGHAILEITDNGLGFNIALHNENLFKLYRRFHTHVEGRGLGLYLIKSQVDVLHGSIEVASEPDKGSTFRVILPLRDEGETHT